MNRILVSVLAVALLALPFVSSGSYATLGDLIEYDTGVKVQGTSGDAVVTWAIEGCVYTMYRAQVTVEYLKTTPPSAKPGGFGDVTIGGYWVEDPEAEGGGIWYGSATFESHINENAKRGVNHGKITINWSPAYPVYSWNFNILHSV